MTSKQQLIAGALLAGLSVALGAFGAHALHPTLEAFGRVDTYETAVRYQMYHALALLLCGILMQQKTHKFQETIGVLFLVGILIFSGSLYVLSLTNITVLGAVTPIGGLAFLAGWVMLVITLIRNY